MDRDVAPQQLSRRVDLLGNPASTCWEIQFGHLLFAELARLSVPKLSLPPGSRQRTTAPRIAPRSPDNVGSASFRSLALFSGSSFSTSRRCWGWGEGCEARCCVGQACCCFHWRTLFQRTQGTIFCICGAAIAKPDCVAEMFRIDWRGVSIGRYLVNELILVRVGRFARLIACHRGHTCRAWSACLTSLPSSVIASHRSRRCLSETRIESRAKTKVRHRPIVTSFFAARSSLSEMKPVEIHDLIARFAFRWRRHHRNAFLAKVQFVVVSCRKPDVVCNVGDGRKTSCK